MRFIAVDQTYNRFCCDCEFYVINVNEPELSLCGRVLSCVTGKPNRYCKSFRSDSLSSCGPLGIAWKLAPDINVYQSQEDADFAHREYEISEYMPQAKKIVNEGVPKVFTNGLLEEAISRVIAMNELKNKS